MRLPDLTRIFVFIVTATTLSAQESDQKAQELARQVWQASGGENWSKISGLRFMFIVEQDGNQIAAAEHHWNIIAGTDHVKWKGKAVTVNLATPAQDDDNKAAYARWVNDSYWLLAPLKVLDPGVKLSTEGSKQLNGVAYETLRLTFDGVGLTPGDQYLLYVDPQTKLVRAWDYVPKADTVMHGTWEKYETFGGLKLATEHSFGGKTIRFTGIDVTLK